MNMAMKRRERPADTIPHVMRTKEEIEMEMEKGQTAGGRGDKQTMTRLQGKV